MDDIVSKFSNHLKSVLTRALCLVVDTKHDQIDPKHLLWALGTQRGCVASEILLKAGVTEKSLGSLVGETSTTPRSLSADQPLIPSLSDESKTIIEKAVLTANLHEHRYIGTEHLLSGLLQISPGEVATFLTEQNVNTRAINQNLATVFKTTSTFPEFPDKPESVASILSEMEQLPFEDVDANDQDAESDSKTPALDYFTQELTDPETCSDIDPVIGRQQEIDRLMKVLCRRTKNNPILVGEPGVGKTAIVEGLARNIVEGAVPEALSDRQIFRLDLASLIAGTMYRGEFESRLRQLIDEVAERPEIILFIDEVHTIMGAGAASGSLDAANILKPALARGSIRCIGATTPAEYKKHIEVDGALERRFQQILVEEPTAEETLHILKGVQSFYEDHHEVTYSGEALQAAVDLSGKYLTNLQYPDKAIDLLDEAGAAATVNKTSKKKPNSASLKRELEHVQQQKQQAVQDERFAEAMDLKVQEQELEERINAFSSKKSSRRKNVSRRDIIRVVAQMIGVDEKIIASDVQKRLADLEKKLQKHIFGQEDVIKTVASTLRRAMFGLSRPNKPLASFLFTGPSGVGKTKLATIVADTIFEKNVPLLRLDMSEYAAPFNASKLVGAPAGYVGYRESSILTDHVKQHPRSVILFDEIEKAHKDVHHLLLQMLDNGSITDATGKKINFRNTVVIMTSNTGADHFVRGAVGFADSSKYKVNAIAADVRTSLEDVFSNEFLNRLDHICLFSPLSQEALEKIARIRVEEIKERLHTYGVDLKVDASAIRWLVHDIDQKFGARDVHRNVEVEVERKVINALLKEPDTKRFDLKGNLRTGIKLISS